MAEIRHNLVIFAPDDSEQRIRLTMTGPWQISAGLAPDVNVAVVPTSEAVKLGVPIRMQRGTIEFWYTSDPAGGGSPEPDVTLEDIWLVDARAEEYGRQPGDTADSVQVVRLAFADVRHAMVEPRGGLLRDGLFNPDPMPADGTMHSTSSLMARAIRAITGETAADIPDTVDDVPAPTNLNWRGSHAPTELGKLLQHCAHVVIPTAEGTLRIVKPLVGDLPEIPEDRLAGDVPSEGIDRRATTVVITSAPTAVTRTYTDAFNEGPGWAFVAQDEDGIWRPLGDLVTDPLAALQSDFADADPEDADRWRRQFYRCVQIDPAACPPGQVHILRRVFYQDGTTGPITLSTELAVRGQTGAWVNQLATIEPRQCVEDANVLVFDELLGTVEGDEAADLIPKFEPLDDIRPTYSVESWHAGAERREYAVFAWERNGETLGPIHGDEVWDDTEVIELLEGVNPDVAIYHAPELRPVIEDDDEDRRNAGDIQERAEKIASELIAAEAVTAKRLRVSGFLAVEMSGRVSSIAYDQLAVETIIGIDEWPLPTRRASEPVMIERGLPRTVNAAGASPLSQAARSAAGAGDSAGPTEAIVGGSGVDELIAPLAPMARHSTGWRHALCQITSVDEATGRYVAKSISGNLDADSIGTLAPEDLGSMAANPDLLVWVPQEIGAETRALSVGSRVTVLLGPRAADGKTVAVLAGATAQSMGEIPLGTEKYQVFQMLTDSTAGWDWVRAHA